MCLGFVLSRGSEANGQIRILFIKTEEQLGDLLTKSLCRVKFQGLCTKIDLIVSMK
jgi:hypothetical protein